MSSSTCPSCGVDLEPDAVAFCTNCGAALPEDAVPVVTRTTRIPMADPPAVSDVDEEGTVPAVVTRTAPIQRAAQPDTDDTMVIARTRRDPFLPPAIDDDEFDDESPVIARAWAGPTERAGAGQLGHQRKLAGALPAWDPLPPGEQSVKRPRKRS